MHRQIILAGVACCALAACTDAVPTEPEALRQAAAGSTTPCSAARAYSLAPVTGHHASISVVGHVQPHSGTVAGQHVYALTIDSRQAGYLQDAVNGGCLAFIEFDTRGTTSALGAGIASYQAHIAVSDGGTTVTFNESGTHPLPGCTTLVCVRNNNYQVGLSPAVGLGTVLTLTAGSSASADAVGFSTSDQAHADWFPRYPRLKIPIP